MLETRALTAFYGDFQALFGIDMHVAAGETVAIIGANGAGK
ncbi:MAG: ABC transporter ATP-binding protein, partial [Acidimicrobiales bacterium]